MQTSRILNKNNIAVRISIFLFTLLIICISFSNRTFAMGRNDPNIAKIQAERNAALLENCPEAIKTAGLAEDTDNEKEGSIIQGYDSTGRPIYIKCNNTKKAIEKIIASIVLYLIIIIGLVLMFAITKASIMMITSGDNAEQFQTATKSLVTSITAVLGVFFSYIFIVFIMTGLLGLGRNSNSNWNLICGNKIVFSLTFGDGKDQCK